MDVYFVSGLLPDQLVLEVVNEGMASEKELEMLALPPSK